MYRSSSYTNAERKDIQWSITLINTKCF
jgi:hypothetical protein